MLLQQFPDLIWLQRQAKTNFADGQAENQTRLPEKGWPSVVLNVDARKAERPDILAPFSLFMNLEGSSMVHADGKENPLSTDTYCLVNKGQTYDLIIPNSAKTFNIHFGEKLVREVEFATSNSHASQLDDLPDNQSIPEVFNRVRWKDQKLEILALRLRQFYQSDRDPNTDLEYELLGDILRHLLLTAGEDRKFQNRISSKKKSTQQELVRRLMISQDYIHTKLDENITSDELSKISSLSKYHFLRSFKEVFGCAPYQYQQHLKMEKAIMLLKSPTLSIQEISWKLNFQEPASFNKAFKKYTGFSPSDYRARN